jgi:hypothetical protein
VAAGIETPRLTFFSSATALDVRKSTKTIAATADLRIKIFMSLEVQHNCYLIVLRNRVESSPCQIDSAMFGSGEASPQTEEAWSHNPQMEQIGED